MFVVKFTVTATILSCREWTFAKFILEHTLSFTIQLKTVHNLKIAMFLRFAAIFRPLWSKLDSVGPNDIQPLTD